MTAQRRAVIVGPSLLAPSAARLAAPADPTHLPSRHDDIAYLLPMGVFLAITQIGAWRPATFVPAYVAKTIIAAILLLLLRKRFTPIRWHAFGWGLLAGVAGTAQWIGMEKLLLHAWPSYPRAHLEVLDPTRQFQSAAALWGFIAVRWLGPTLIVPFVEELFWRDWLWRTLLAPNDFKLAAVGEADWRAFAIVAIMFGTVHLQMWPTAIVWGCLAGGLLIWTRSLGACIVCHAVANFLLGGWVLWRHDWMFW